MERSGSLARSSKFISARKYNIHPKGLIGMEIPFYSLKIQQTTEKKTKTLKTHAKLKVSEDPLGLLYERK